MSFQEFKSYYQERRQFFERYEYQSLLKKAYIKFRKGSEIKFQDVFAFKENTSSLLSEILVDVPQIKLVKERIYQSLETVKTTSETDVCIVYGDYGYGKSQTAHILVEDLTIPDYLNRFVHFENISTFRTFFQNFGTHLRKQISTKEKLQSLDISYFVEIFEKARSEGEFSVSKLTQAFVEYLQYMSKEGITHVVILDELDKIVHDETERKNWIDLFVTLNDESGLSLLLVCLIPQRMANQLINVDRRLERWNHFFNINATVLDGKYSTEVIRAIASILALHDYYHQFNPAMRSLQFVYDIMSYKMDYLEAVSIRSVNTWVLILGELILQFEGYHIWEKYAKFSSHETYDRAKFLNSKMQVLLQLDNLPQFELRRDDSEDTDSYRLEFNSKSLSLGKYSSSGQFRIYELFMNTERLVLQVALVIDYAEKRSNIDHNKFDVISEKYPTIALILGLESINEFQQDDGISKKIENQVVKYPSEMISIPQTLLPPLLLIPENETTQGYNQIVQLVINWSNVITGHREKLLTFLRDLPTEIIRREILLRSLKLAQMIPENISPDREVLSSPTQIKGNKVKIFLAANIVSTIEEISNFMYLTTLEKNVSNTLMAQFPGEALETMQEFDRVITLLENHHLVIMGGSKRITIKKSEIWDQMKAIDLLKSKLT